MTVRHSRGSYPVLFVTFQEALSALEVRSAFITDENVAAEWGKHVSGPMLTLPPGERSKSFAGLETCVRWLADIGATRSWRVVALGGGVIGDLAGLAAAVFMRGVRLVHVPTSLLAQVDSCVGGKVGIDLLEGKNLVGAFHPPEAVYVCTETLDTLPDNEFLSGTAEVWKYGAALDSSLFEALEAEPLKKKDRRLTKIVQTSLELKARIVEADEFESTGLRAKLNFGHTVGHAVEQLTGYGPISHGQAVAIGMTVEAALGERLGLSEKGSAERLRSGLASQELPTQMPPLAPARLLGAMRSDKKASEGRLAFALLTRIGDCKLVEDVPDADVVATLTQI